ncbi:tetratricopeptide repeat protein [Pseudothauera lacus]|nr:tetratricopeptide repeat protein [Pseudothauera lacus]
MDAVQSIYQEAVAAQLAGRMEDAKVAYRRLLEEVPDHPEGHHNLGLLAYQEGEVEQALEHLMNAVEARPGEAEFWHSLIGVLVALSAFDHAHNALEQAGAAGIAAEELERMRQCIAAAEVPPPPEPVEPVQLSIDGEREEILAAVQRILVRSRAQKASGKKAELRGRIPERKVIDRMTRLFNAGELRELEQFAGKLTRSHPLHPAGWHFLGMARMRLGERLESLRALIKANELHPGDALMLDHLGTALTSFNYVAEAASLFELSLEIRPNKIDTIVRYANLAVSCRDLDRAEELARRAVEVAPCSAMACRMMAIVLLHRRSPLEAVPYLEQAIQADPTMGDAYQDLGYAYFSLGMLDKSVSTSELAVERNPENAAAYSNLLFFMTHQENLSPEEVLRKHLGFGERFEVPLGDPRPHENDRNPERRLRIGFVSADFYNHAVAHFLMPVLEHIDRDRFDLFAFHNTVKFDETSEKLKSLFKYWVAVSHVSDRDLAEIVRACRIDVLIDLSGHTAGNRLLTFARKPAPVQMSWIGYVDTTGLRSIDYYVTDRFLAPLGQFDEHFSERLLRLDSAVAFTFDQDAPPVGPAPMLRNGFVTFGSFNRPGKITSTTLDLWAALLNAVPDARILIGSVETEDTQRHLTQELSLRCVSEGRLRFLPRVTLRAYLEAHNEVDILLDTFPYNAGTTALHSLWMGVPVLTMNGSRMLSNVGAALMSKAELPDFVGEDGEDFVSKGAALAKQPHLLAGIRAGMRERLMRQQLFSARYVTRCLEGGFRSAWLDWCARRE